MFKKIINLIGTTAIIAGVVLVFGAMGKADTLQATFSQTVLQCTIGIVISIAGAFTKIMCNY